MTRLRRLPCPTGQYFWSAKILTRLMRQYFWRANIFDAPIFLTRQHFCRANIFAAPTFLPRQRFCRANVFAAPTFLPRQHFWRANIFDAPYAPIFLTRQNFWRANIFDAPIFSTRQNSLHRARTYGLRTSIHRTLTQSVFVFTHGPPHLETPPKVPLLKQARESFCESIFWCMSLCFNIEHGITCTHIISNLIELV